LKGLQFNHNLKKEFYLTITFEGPTYNTANLCEPILRSLPEWFGIEEDLRQYVSDIETLPTFLVKENGKVVCFLSLKLHNSQAAEVYVMGVLQTLQGKGIGRELMRKAEEWLSKEGVTYLQVKTLGPSCEDENYARTRAFYEAIDFVPLEELKQIWDEANPCLIMVKKLDVSIPVKN